MLTFESTHEYYLGNDPSLYYCEEHSSLMITQDHEDRLLISGISKSTMLQFASKFYKESLKKELNESDSQKQQADAVKAEV